MKPAAGILYGVGLGPGDPELMTLKAARLLSQADVVSYFCKAPQKGHAYTIVSTIIRDDHKQLPLVYPVTTQYPVDDPRYETQLHDFYEEAAQAIAQYLKKGENVALVAVGDPFFYGSFMHMYHRLSGKFTCEVIPGITSMSGCWTNARTPITWGDDVLTVLPGTMDKQQLTKRLKNTDAAVIMKLGSNFPAVREALMVAGLHDRAIYIEYGTMANERILPLSQKTDDEAPYFSLIIVAGQGRRL